MRQVWAGKTGSELEQPRKKERGRERESVNEDWKRRRKKNKKHTNGGCACDEHVDINLGGEEGGGSGIDLSLVGSEDVAGQCSHTVHITAAVGIAIGQAVTIVVAGGLLIRSTADRGGEEIGRKDRGVRVLVGDNDEDLLVVDAGGVVDVHGIGIGDIEGGANSLKPGLHTSSG